MVTFCAVIIFQKALCFVTFLLRDKIVIITNSTMMPSLEFCWICSLPLASDRPTLLFIVSLFTCLFLVYSILIKISPRFYYAVCLSSVNHFVSIEVVFKCSVWIEIAKMNFQYCRFAESARWANWKETMTTYFAFWL